MIGNDVVDLKLAESQSNWQRKGFLDKVFSVSEKDLIRNAECKEVMVWLLWSMKEAAYKAHQRRFLLPRKLNWQQQPCELHTISNISATGSVTIDGHRYFSTSDISSGAIHSSLVSERNSLFKYRCLKEPSEGARTRLCELAARHYGFPNGFFSIVKNIEGIPFLMHGDKPFSTAFSLSSHGRYSAFCLSLMDR